jgi:hypothetical protein
MNQRGSINLPVVIAAAFGIGLAASMYLNYSQSQTAEQDRKLMQGQITDLRYQVKQDGLASASSASPTPSPLATPESSATPTPAPVLGASTAKAAIIKKSSAQPNLRSQPNSKSSSVILVSHVAAGTPVTYVDESLSSGYAHVTINGTTGYILASYLQ